MLWKAVDSANMHEQAQQAPAPVHVGACEAHPAVLVQTANSCLYGRSGPGLKTSRAHVPHMYLLRKGREEHEVLATMDRRSLNHSRSSIILLNGMFLCWSHTRHASKVHLPTSDIPRKLV